jgi:hypothetical protein
MVDELTSKQYEQLTQRLIGLITSRSPVETTRLEHDVTLRGSSTTHQIDVLWEFREVNSSLRRIIIECRRFYSGSLKQAHVFAFKGVVDDLNTGNLPTTGVMVTVQGYQKGAQSVANSYGVVILQLREPTTIDLKGRLRQIRVEVEVRMPYIGPEVQIQAVRMLADYTPQRILANEYGLLLANGTSILLQDLLWSEVIGSLDAPPVAPHPVTRTFSPPAVLTLRGEPLAQITEVTASVGETLVPASSVAVAGSELAWMIANVLDGTRVWFTDTDRTHVSDDQNGGSTLATDVILGRAKSRSIEHSD